jgi:hypothetical protein
LVFLGGIAKINSILVMVLRIPTGISGAVIGNELKTSSLGDCTKKYQQFG